MHSLRAVLLAMLTLCGFAVAVPTAAAPTPAPPQDVSPTTFQSDQNATVANGTLGSEISSFMQVSTSQATGTVDTGLWIAQFNGTKNKSARQTLVRDRVTKIQSELEDVRQRKEKLVKARKNGNISTLQYQARMSKLVGEIRSLEHSINTTKPRAERVGTRVQRLQQLEKRTSTVGGSEVAEVARSLRSVNVPGENANNSTGAQGVGTDNGNIGIGNGDGGNGNASVGIGNGSGNGNASVGIENGNGNGRNSNTTTDDGISLALLSQTGEIV